MEYPKEYRNQYMLLNSGIKPIDVTDENTPLYTLQSILIMSRLGDYDITHHVNDLNAYINLLKKETHFNNIPEVYTGDDKYISHDQYRTICVFSKLYGLDHHKFIWKGIKKGFFTYDNISKGFNIKRLVHPRDIIYIGYLNNNYLCKAFYPFYLFLGLLTLIEDTKTRPTLTERISVFLKTGEWLKTRDMKKTDGELLFWVESHIGLNCFLSQRFRGLCNWIIGKRFGSWKGVFNTYYPDENHPINVLCSKGVKGFLDI